MYRISELRWRSLSTCPGLLWESFASVIFNLLRNLQTHSTGAALVRHLSTVYVGSFSLYLFHICCHLCSLWWPFRLGFLVVFICFSEEQGWLAMPFSFCLLLCLFPHMEPAILLLIVCYYLNIFLTISMYFYCPCFCFCSRLACKSCLRRLFPAAAM